MFVIGVVDRWDNKIWELPAFYFPCMNKQGRELPFFLVVTVCGLLVVEVGCVSWFWWLCCLWCCRCGDVVVGIVVDGVGMVT